MGKVFLVGAGPGDPELLTCKASRILRSANVVLHDSLVSEEVLRLIPQTAERIDVGKRRGFKLLSQQDINSLLVAAAAQHQTVVRLKGGDPLLFGRAAEEIQALREAAIEFEIVPGISSAFGAAAAVRVSAHRSRSRFQRSLHHFFALSRGAAGSSQHPNHRHHRGRLHARPPLQRGIRMVSASRPIARDALPGRLQSDAAGSADASLYCRRILRRFRRCQPRPFLSSAALWLQKWRFPLPWIGCAIQSAIDFRTTA